MAVIQASAGFRLRMDANGNIPELDSYWTTREFISGDGAIRARLIDSGPFSTTYRLEATGDIVSSLSRQVSGLIDSLALVASSPSAFGQNGVQLEISGAEVEVYRASRLPLSLFITGDDTITGSALGDVLVGLTGNDLLDGRAGRDVLDGGLGDDTLLGGARDADTLIGGLGDDVYFVSDRRHVIVESAGGGRDTVVARVDYALESLAHIELLVVDGDVEPATVITLTGSNTANRIEGHDGRNVLFGLGGRDTILGGGGNDTIEGGQGGDLLVGGDGYDRLSYVRSAKGVIVDLGQGLGHAGDALGDMVAEFEEVVGSVHSDRIRGDALDNRLIGLAGNDRLLGGLGNDILVGGRGSDTMVGGAGFDRLDYGQDPAGVVVHLARGTARDGYGYRDLISTFEEVRGSRFADVITGTILSETLRGQAGNDRLSGGGGNDKLFGGAGLDTLTGGAGEDIFIFNTRPNRSTNVDRITDFNPAADRIFLDKAVFRNIGFEGTVLTDDFFHLGTRAEDELTRIVYDQSTGSLYYDPDGTGSIAQVRFAVLSNKAALESFHFYVI